VKNIWKAFQYDCLSQINLELCTALINSLLAILNAIARKAPKNQDISLLADHEPALFEIIITAFSFLNAYEGEAAKTRELTQKVMGCVDVIDKVVQRGEGRFMIRNAKNLVAELVHKEYKNATKHSMELKQILLIYQLLDLSDLSVSIETPEPTIIPPKPSPPPEAKMPPSAPLGPASTASTTAEGKAGTVEESKDSIAAQANVTVPEPMAAQTAPPNPPPVEEIKSVMCAEQLPKMVTMTLESCAYFLAKKLAKESKDKEVAAKAVGLLEMLLEKRKGALETVSEMAVGALCVVFDADIEPKAFVILRERILKVLDSIRRTHKRPLPDTLIRSWIETGIKAVAMTAKEFTVRRSGMLLLCLLSDETLEGNRHSPALSEWKTVLPLALDEMWSKNEDIRLAACKCLQNILRNCPPQSEVAETLASMNLPQLLLTQKNVMKDLVDAITLQLNTEDGSSFALIGSMKAIVDKLITFAVDEGGPARDTIRQTLVVLARTHSLFILKEYITALVQGYLVRTQFIKALFKDAHI
jgi:hypothetical protein